MIQPIYVYSENPLVLILASKPTLKKEYFFLVEWFPVVSLWYNWFGRDGAFPGDIVFFNQEDAELAGDPNGDKHDDEPTNMMKTWYILWISAITWVTIRS